MAQISLSEAKELLEEASQLGCGKLEISKTQLDKATADVIYC